MANQQNLKNPPKRVFVNHPKLDSKIMFISLTQAAAYLGDDFIAEHYPDYHGKPEAFMPVQVLSFLLTHKTSLTDGIYAGLTITPKLDNTNNPDNSGKSDNTNNPDNSGKSDNTNNPDNSGKSDNTNNPDNSGKSGNTGNSVILPVTDRTESIYREDTSLYTENASSKNRWAEDEFDRVFYAEP